MASSQLLNQVIAYGIKNKKRKDEIMSALLESGQFDVTQAATSVKTLSDMGVFDYQNDSIDQSSIDQKAKDKLGTGALLQQYYTNRNILDSIQKYKDSYLSASKDNKVLPTVSTGKKSAELKAMYNDIIFQVAQAEGTGALQEADRKIVESMLPDVSTANPLSIAGQSFRGGREGNTAAFDTLLTSAKDRVERLSGEKLVDQSGQPGDSDSLQKFNATLQHAQQNPNDPRAQKFLQMVQGGQIDWKTGKLVQGQNQTMNQTSALNQDSSQSSEPSTMEKVGEGLGGFFGGKQWGKAIGEVIGTQLAKHGEAGKVFEQTISRIEQMYQEGKIDEAMRDKLLDAQEKNAKEAFGYKGPTFKQLAADTALMALSVAGGAEVKGATVLGTAAKTAAWGGGQGALSATAEGKDARETVIDAAIGAATGGALGAVAKGAKPLYEAIAGKNSAAEALGEILQGKTKDLKPGQRVLSVLDVTGNKEKADAIKQLIEKGDLDEATTQRYQELENVYRNGVKNSPDLKLLLDDFISLSAKKVDETLSQDNTLAKLEDLVTIGKTKGGQEVKTNYVQKGLEQLQELYTKIGDEVEAGNIQELIDKAKAEGLSKLEVNQIARQYGIEFGDKAFGKLGDPLTSVNAQMYENTRKGLKEVARQGVEGEAAKELDSLMSDSFRVRDLVKKNIEAANRLEQRVEKMGLGRKIVKTTLDITNLLTGGALRGVKDYFTQSNVGKKTMNSLDIEERMAENLKIIKQAEKADTPGKLESAIKQFNRNVFNKVKDIRPGLTIKELDAKSAQFRETYRRLSKAWDNAKTPAARKQAEKAIQRLIENSR